MALTPGDMPRCNQDAPPRRVTGARGEAKLEQRSSGRYYDRGAAGALINSTRNIAISAPGSAKAANSRASFFISRKHRTDEAVPPEVFDQQGRRSDGWERRPA